MSRKSQRATNGLATNQKITRLSTRPLSAGAEGDLDVPASLGPAHQKIAPSVRAPSVSFFASGRAYLGWGASSHLTPALEVSPRLGTDAAHRKEGVDGSSPSEGFQKTLQSGDFRAALACIRSNVIRYGALSGAPSFPTRAEDREKRRI